MQLLDSGEPQKDRHHVLGDQLHAIDATGQALHFNVRRGPHLADLDPEIGERHRLAEQRVTLADLVSRDAGRCVADVPDRAVDDPRPARGAVTALAAVRQVEARAQRGGEHRLAGLGSE